MDIKDRLHESNSRVKREGLQAFAGWFLLVASVIGGIATAMFYSNIVAIIAEVFPPMERGKALGINVAVAYIGLSTGPFIGGMMAHQWGWRSIFILSLPIAIVGLVLGLKSLPAKQQSDESKSFDLFGSVIYGRGATIRSSIWDSGNWKDSRNVHDPEYNERKQCWF